MTTQVSFTTDEALKNKAMKKAKEEGITLKTLFVYAMKGFVEGKFTLGILPVDDEEPEVEEFHIDDEEFQKKAAQLAQLLK